MHRIRKVFPHTSCEILQKREFSPVFDVGKRIFDVPETIRVDFDHIETDALVKKPVFLQIIKCRARDAGLLDMGDGFPGRSVGERPALLYLNKRYLAIHPCDQIHLAWSAPVIARKDDGTMPLKVHGCRIFPLGASPQVHGLPSRIFPMKLLRCSGQGPSSRSARMCSAVPYPLWRAKP